MIPLRDDIPSQRTPIVNWAIIAICVLVYAVQAFEPEDQPSLVEKFGFIPARLGDPEIEVSIPIERQVDSNGNAYLITRPAGKPSVSPTVALLTCTFLHGGLMHLLGNVWFLWIFGDNIEDRFGHVGFLVLYLVCGVTASFVHYWSDPTSTIPTIGASGAIAGVMGAYLVSYPHARVLALVPLFVILFTYVVPAPLFLGLWLFAQVSGVLQPGAGGVAWWAHIGGFAIGVAVTFGLAKIGLLAPVNRRRLVTTTHRVQFR